MSKKLYLTATIILLLSLMVILVGITLTNDNKLVVPDDTQNILSSDSNSSDVEEIDTVQLPTKSIDREAIYSSGITDIKNASYKSPITNIVVNFSTSSEPQGRNPTYQVFVNSKSIGHFSALAIRDGKFSADEKYFAWINQSASGPGLPHNQVHMIDIKNGVLSYLDIRLSGEVAQALHSYLDSALYIDSIAWNKDILEVTYYGLGVDKAGLYLVGEPTLRYYTFVDGKLVEATE